MASANFRIGTATTNSAGTVWSWRDYDEPTDIVSGSYVKVDLESTNGVRTLAVSIPFADEATMLDGVPTVTTVQSSKTATFQAGTGTAKTYLVRSTINSGVDLNGDTVATYTKQLAVHIKTVGGLRLISVSETDEADRTYGYIGKLNATTLAAANALPSGSEHQVIQYNSGGTPVAKSVIALASVATPSAVTGVAQIYCSGGALLAINASGAIKVIASA